MWHCNGIPKYKWSREVTTLTYRCKNDHTHLKNTSLGSTPQCCFGICSFCHQMKCHRCRQKRSSSGSRGEGYHTVTPRRSLGFSLNHCFVDQYSLMPIQNHLNLWLSGSHPHLFECVFIRFSLTRIHDPFIECLIMLTKMCSSHIKNTARLLIFVFFLSAIWILKGLSAPFWSFVCIAFLLTIWTNSKIK